LLILKLKTHFLNSRLLGSKLIGMLGLRRLRLRRQQKPWLLVLVWPRNLLNLVLGRQRLMCMLVNRPLLLRLLLGGLRWRRLKRLRLLRKLLRKLLLMLLGWRLML
jgi:hypothetical protein